MAVAEMFDLHEPGSIMRVFTMNTVARRGFLSRLVSGRSRWLAACCSQPDRFRGTQLLGSPRRVFRGNE
jgi:hypothetical protein